MISAIAPDPETRRLRFPSYARVDSLATLFAPTIGALIAVVVACVYGLPSHAVVGLFAGPWLLHAYFSLSGN